MASPNQVTSYYPESLQIIQMDTAQTETPLPTEEEYLKDMELEAKHVGSSEPVQEAEAENGDNGSSVTSRLTSVSRQDADTVVGPASITGSIGRIESLEHKTEQLEASLAALPTQIMSAVRVSFQDMFTAALTQALPEIVAQVSNSVLKAMQPWVIAQIKTPLRATPRRLSASRPPVRLQKAFRGRLQVRTGPLHRK
ncbi:hypothetical protein MRX96_032151 [Rhipicephalus microplus]